MATLSPQDFLHDLLSQLEERKRRIEEYLKQEGTSRSRRDFTTADIQKINERINETAAAIDGISCYHMRKKGKNSYCPVLTSIGIEKARKSLNKKQ